MNLSRYNKFIVAIVGAGIGWGALVITSDPAGITASEWLSLITGIATSLGVYQVRNSY